ncbi:MFS transporter [Candidatus Uhrbacteria bacterium]|jgi:MFS family permease|nr:MFS transporter [Candidatus Uhrbacteria bacterium]MBT7717066.1 MFS transporter [Candidatus Uhrbacteria bacterium]
MRSTKAFYIFTFLTRLGMGSICSVYVLYLLDLGLSYSQVTLVNALFFVFLILFELPTGMLADGRGRGYSVIGGALFTALSGAAYWLADGLWMAIVAEALCAVGSAFFTGALTAWIADAPDRKISLQKVYANRTIMDGAGMTIGTLFGVYIATWSDRADAFLFFMAWYFVAMIFAGIFMRGKEPEHTLSEFEALKHATDHLKGSVSMRWALGVELVTGFFGAYNLFWAPLMITQFSQVELGWIWILMYAVCIIAGLIVRKQSEDEESARNHLATRTVKALVLVAVAMAFIWTTGSGFVWIAMIAVHEFGRGLVTPYLETYVQQRVDTSYRATYGSLQSFLGLFGLVAVQLTLTGVFKFVGSDISIIPWLWLVTSCLMLVACAALYKFRPKM